MSILTGLVRFKRETIPLAGGSTKKPPEVGAFKLLVVQVFTLVRQWHQHLLAFSWLLRRLLF